MSNEPVNKHAQRTARTRARIIRAAEQLYAARGIDAVSLNEIVERAGQKNRNALQYHFGDKAGLLAALIEPHHREISAERKVIIEHSQLECLAPAQQMARALIQPIHEHMQASRSGACYVQIMAQLALRHGHFGNDTRISVPGDDALAALSTEALAHLSPAERSQRLFLAVGATFHCLADIERSTDAGAGIGDARSLTEQLILMVAGMLAAPPIEGA